MSGKGFSKKSGKAILDPAGSIKKNGFKDTWKASSDPGDLFKSQQKESDQKAKIKDQAAAEAELSGIRGRMMPNSPLNSFRPYVDTTNQPPDMSGRLPPMAQGQQFDPAILRQMMQVPQYGQIADQQWQQMKQSTMQPPVAPPMSQPGNLPPSGAAPTMGMPTEQQMAMMAVKNRMRAIR